MLNLLTSTTLNIIPVRQRLYARSAVNNGGGSTPGPSSFTLFTVPTNSVIQLISNPTILFSTVTNGAAAPVYGTQNFAGTTVSQQQLKATIQPSNWNQNSFSWLLSTPQQGGVSFNEIYGIASLNRATSASFGIFSGYFQSGESFEIEYTSNAAYTSAPAVPIWTIAEIQFTYKLFS